MAARKKTWVVLEGNPRAEEELARECGVPAPVARVLVNRGLLDGKAAAAFLSPARGNMHDPFMLPDMKEAAGRIVDAVARGEKIRVYGDYDADGVTAVSLLVTVLSALGASVDYRIPNRLVEGYGLSTEAIERAADEGVSVMVTVDCGIGAVEEALAARSRGMDLIITDHHEAGPEIPRALAVINPKRKGSLYPFKDLAGVGVAFKLAQAFWELSNRPAGHGDPWRHLDIVALGTIADVVPLVGENRIIARAGLAMMKSSQNLGIRNLIDVSGFAGREIKAGNVGFSMAPRVNAAGRLGDPSLGARLFLTDSQAEAAGLAAMLDEENRKRQEIEAGIFRDAWAPVSKMNTASTRAIVLGSESWHSGVIGIVASKIAELTCRPTVLVSFDGDVGRGSGRSIPGFNLHSALTECSDLLLKYGGHAQAAGLSIRADDLDRFRERLNELGHRWLTPEDLVPQVSVDAELQESEISIELARGLAVLEPFGLGNPTPVFLTRRLLVLEQKQVGPEGRHLKLKLGKGSRIVDAIGFRMAQHYADLARQAGEVDVAYGLEVNEWNGRESAELNLKDMRRSEAV
ncbi:MAG: single-stranded-DNA-specific exonuclease RecJ [Clostridia bacterium]|nr:single-stranded-DNA-specific exonuclease RecJ [Clostridia bacterium]